MRVCRWPSGPRDGSAPAIGGGACSETNAPRTGRPGPPVHDDRVEREFTSRCRSLLGESPTIWQWRRTSNIELWRLVR